METTETLEEKKNAKHLEEVTNSLIAEYQKKTGFISRILSGGQSLSKDTAYIGLVLLNKIKGLDENNSDYYYWHNQIAPNSKRFNALAAIASPEQFWEGDRYMLLEFIFGTRIAPLVKKAWDMVPHLMYQTGYYRRSFRSSNAKDLYFSRQLNLVISLIHQTNYNLSLEEYIQYSNSIHETDFSYLYAAAIDLEDTSIKQLLLDTIYGRHEIARPSRTLIKGMLLSSNEECWTAVEKLLLSAQRQEGLRQTILESLDETSLGAMKHIIAVIIEHKLSRFSSVVRAVDTWAGFGWEAEKETTVRRFLTFAHHFLTHPEDIEKAIYSKDNAEVYMALWAQGVIDVEQCYPLLDEVIQGNQEKILLALYFVSQVGLPSFSLKYSKHFIEDADMIVRCQAANLLNNPSTIYAMSQKEKEELFSVVEAQVDDLPAKKTLSKPLVFSWLVFRYEKEMIQDLMISLLDLNKEEDIDKITPHFEELGVNHREKITNSILGKYSYYQYQKDEKRAPLSKKHRDFAFSILKDRSESIKITAMRALDDVELNQEEIEVFEGLLVRKSADFRKQTIALILKQTIAGVKESATRLLEAKNVEQRLAGLDILLWIKNNSEETTWVEERVVEYEQRKSIGSKEEIVLSGLRTTSAQTEEYSPEKGFGLFNPKHLPVTIAFDANCSADFTTEMKKKTYGLSKTVEEINGHLERLKTILKENEEYEYTIEGWDGKQTCLLGNSFSPIKKDMSGMSAEEQLLNYPLHEKWEEWYADAQLTPKDLFLIDLMSKIGVDDDEDDKAEQKPYGHFNKLLTSSIYIPSIPKMGRHVWQNPIFTILTLLSNKYKYTDSIDLIEDLFRYVISKVDEDTLHSYHKVKQRWSRDKYVTWRDQPVVYCLWSKYNSFKKEMTALQYEKYWQLAQFHFLTLPKEHDIQKESKLEFYDYVRAHDEQHIGKDQLYWRAMHSDAINELTREVRKGDYKIKEDFPFLNEVLDDCRNRILEIELVRGDSSTSVTLLAQHINKLFGIDNFVHLLKAMGKDPLHRGYIYSWGSKEYNKKEILSTLLKKCYPQKEEDQKYFNKKVKEAAITEKRLCDACTYAPQWLPLVASYLGWKEMESAVWWLHAHTNGHHDSQTESEIAKYSAVEIAAFRDGAVDYNWFKEVYKVLKKDRWKKLSDAAKYISDGGGHKRGLLYADVILGNTKIKEITERIVSKRNQDYLRVYGVIPLSRANPKKDVLKRYQFLQKFKKESKQFGSQRQASEATAVKIAMENLARTAGYPDPIRLQWAMETKEAQEIVANASALHFEDTEIRLEIDEQGKSSIIAIKEGKQLKSIPAKYRKEKALEKLKGYNKTLREQHRRTRKSLENAMINGDVFTKEEIENLGTHPVVAPMLKKLVLVMGDQFGFFEDNSLVTLSGNTVVLEENIRIAHCVDLYEVQEWSEYQHYCFENKVVQPFKQIFRELYVPTVDELKEETISRRYAGHQVQPNKTVALLKGQSWTVDYDDGLQKVHHKQNIIARMFAMADWFSPADVESPTLETVQFFDRKKGGSISFEKVDKRVFSETMRDIDLVVSVAHVGDVDPEASQSSIELRTVIVKETCKLFKLDNVTFSENHAKIQGELGNYSVHLGSGVCHKVASASLSIIPVHSQHRGRMFLPFVDEDPKTAEIISKVLLLAKDKEIKDPTILGQL